MSLQQQLPDAGLRVRWVDETGLGIGEESVRHSLVLGVDGWKPWPPTCLEDIDEAALETLVSDGPSLVLLGTGARQRFLSPRMQAQLMARGIGIECMDNGAAARTFNLLADEGRRVVAAFLFGGRD